MVLKSDIKEGDCSNLFKKRSFMRTYDCYVCGGAPCIAAACVATFGSACSAHNLLWSVPVV